MTIAEFILQSKSERPQRPKKAQRARTYRRAKGRAATSEFTAVVDHLLNRPKSHKLDPQESDFWDGGYTVVRLSDPQLSDKVEKLSKRIQSDPNFALRLLRKAGIATDSGELSKRYGG